MFGGKKVKIEKELYSKAEMYAKVAGYTSVEEFINHIVEKELATFGEGDSEEEIKKKLQGLGYIS
ncbi:MAG: hypothetical protein KAW17_10300 [Candidatus Eisenbacteria sp.]|nr:hypothetical protein [Candidatus Eisenbacteria bacterium]